MPGRMGNELMSRNTILEKSRILFRERGYSNTSIALLATACNMSKSHFYYYFKNKEVLMEEVLKEELRFFDDRIFQIAYEEAFSPKKRLKKIFKKLENVFCKKHAGSLITMAIFHAADQERERFYPLIQAFYKAWEKALYTIFSSKLSKKKSRKLTARALLQIEGSLVLMMISNDASSFQEAAKDIQSEFALY